MHTMSRILLLIMVLCGTAATAQVWNCGDTLIDTRDGKHYATVQIGNACWMKQNLDYGIYAQSDSTANFHSDVSNNGIVEKYCQANDSTNCATHGGLYDWDEMMNYNAGNPQGICPNGWHVANDVEFSTMIAATGGVIGTNGGTGGNALKAVGEGWGAGVGTDASGFSARSAGDRDAWGIFTGFGHRFIFWTSTPNFGSAWHYMLWDENDTIQRLGTIHLITGLSCRCVMNGPNGIGQAQPEQDMIRVFPNPAQTRVSLRIGQLYNTGSLTIYNAQGQQVKTVTLETSQSEVGIAELPSGTYVLLLQLDEQLIRKTIVIKR